MKSASQPARPRSNYALFLGDLSIFCTEKDIEDAFSSYGEIVNVRIQRSKETSRALSYGFIEFSCETAAVTAMNEMNSYVLKGRPLRIRWAAKRNQPVKSENSALNSAATIFVKFASQTGIIVTEQLLREHFSAYGEVLDTTIRTITIDEAYNRSKGYGFVNFVNSPDQDGLAIAYKASAELQNSTVAGVNYRCEVGYKHQKGDTESVGAYTASTSGNASLALSNTSASYNGGFLPAISPRHFYGPSSSSVNSAGMSCSPSQSSSGPSSPHPAAFYPVNSAAQAGALSSSASVHSTGSGSASGVYSHHSGNHSYGPHSPHPVSTIVSTISFLPTPGMQNMYPQGQQAVSQAPHGMYAAQGMPQQVQYAPAQQQQYMQQQQYLQQQQYYAQQQQQQYYAQQQPAAYGPHSPSHGHGHGQYYPAAQAAPQYYSAPQQDQYQAPQHQQQYYPAQGYYQQASQAHMPMAPAPGVHSNRVRPPAVYETQPVPQQMPQQGAYLTEQALSQHQGRNRRGSMGPPVASAQSYAQHPHTFMQHVYEPNVPEPAGAGPNGRRSQRNISNKSNISEITSATLNELQCDEEDELLEEGDEEVAAPLPHTASHSASNTAPNTATVTPSASTVTMSASAASSEVPVLAAPATVTSQVTSNATQMPAPANPQTPADHLKSTLQIQTATAPIINCKLAQRRNRSVSGGSNTTEITAAVLYDLQMQEQRLEQEEEEGINTEPPQPRDSHARLTTTPCASPDSMLAAVQVKVVTPKALAAASRKNRAAGSPRSPLKAELSQSPARRPSQSISPFTLSAATLAQLQADAEAADATAKPERRNKRNISDRSNQSDITAALAFMQIDGEPFASLALEDLDDDCSSAEVSVCICGKADGAVRDKVASPYSCPFGTTACSCVYRAMC